MKLFERITLLQLVASASMLIIAFSLTYYLVIFVPSKEKAKLQVYKDCEVEANNRAKSLLGSKIEVAEKTNLTHTQEYKTMKEASVKGLYLKDDYNEYYNACIRRHGLKY